MVGAVEMRDVCHVTLEPLIADLTEKDLFLLALFVLLNTSHVFLDVEVLLTTHQQASLQSALCLRDDWLLLLFLALRSLLDPIFLAAPLVCLSVDCALKLRWLAHLL
jgi:hypothetical protein